MNIFLIVLLIYPVFNIFGFCIYIQFHPTLSQCHAAVANYAGPETTLIPSIHEINVLLNHLPMLITVSQFTWNEMQMRMKKKNTVTLVYTYRVRFVSQLQRFLYNCLHVGFLGSFVPHMHIISINQSPMDLMCS